MKIDDQLTAQIEPFDTFWEAPKNIEQGYTSFGMFYKRNYSKYIPAAKDVRILVVSCGQGYFLNLLKEEGYTNVLGIDSDPEKLRYAQKRNLNCRVENAFPFLENNQEPFDVIFAEQEVNHLTKKEIQWFLGLCHQNLSEGGVLIVHSLNGANPITGSEALAQNFDHYNSFTEYSLRQVLQHAQFEVMAVIPLVLYVFYRNPLNYVGMFIDTCLNLLFKLSFIFYGKQNKIFSKKFAAISSKIS
jgi:2-polyprenyl-3-methyl-5-hydroxy-6-metoxy-1,4-benzoquinol methylase